MQAKRGYLACGRYVDRQIGKVLDALEEQGLADSTIVVLWGDHGSFPGEAAAWSKHSPLEAAVHSPLIIRAPGITKPGVKTDALASTIDIYPTLIDLCKPTFSQTAYPLDGVSQLPVLTGERPSVREVSVSAWGGATTYRTESFRLVFTKKNDKKTEIELYNLDQENGAYIDLAETHPQLLRDVMQQVTLWEAQAAEVQ